LPAQGLRFSDTVEGYLTQVYLGNLSAYLLEPLRRQWPEAGIQDLKIWYRGRCYASAILKMLPEPPEPILCERLLEQISRLGCIHSASARAADLEMAA
jgi:hypothetical protein